MFFFAPDTAIVLYISHCELLQYHPEQYAVLPVGCPDASTMRFCGGFGNEKSDAGALIDASSLSVSAMGTMNTGR